MHAQGLQETLKIESDNRSNTIVDTYEKHSHATRFDGAELQWNARIENLMFEHTADYVEVFFFLFSYYDSLTQLRYHHFHANLFHHINEIWAANEEKCIQQF